MKTRQLLAILLVFVALLALMTACGETEKPEETLPETKEIVIPDNLAERFAGYSVIRADAAKDYESNAAVKVREYFLSGGFEIPITTDWVKKGQEVPANCPEILVGLTNRPESIEQAEGLRFDDYAVSKVGERIIIVGGSESALNNACEWFAANVLAYDGEGFSESGDSYVYRHTYAVTSATVENVNLSDFRICIAEETSDMPLMAEELRGDIKEKVGYDLGDALAISLERVKKKPSIYFMIDPSMPEGYRVSVEDGCVLLLGSDKANLRTAMDAFCDALVTESTYAVNNGSSIEGKAAYNDIQVYLKAGATDGDGSEAKPFGQYDELHAFLLEWAGKSPCHFHVHVSGQFDLDKSVKLLGKELDVYATTISFVSDDETPAIFATWKKISGFTETEINGVKAWVAEFPEELDSNSFFTSDFKRLALPRLPEKKEKFAKVTGIPGVDKLSSIGWNTQSEGLIYKEGFLDDIKLSQPDRVIICCRHFWNDDHMKIGSINYDTRTINFTAKSPMGMVENGGAGAQFFLLNVFEALNEPGEVYADKEAHKLYYVPSETDKLDGFYLYASTDTKVVTIEDFHGADGEEAVSFENIAFYGADWVDIPSAGGQGGSSLSGAITINRASDISFKNCEIAHVGENGVKILAIVDHVTFDHCLVTDIGGAGFDVAGYDPATETTDRYLFCAKDVVITDSEISHFGRIFANGVGVLFRYTNNCTLSHCEVFDGYYTGVSLGWAWSYAETPFGNNTIEKNHIYNIGQGVLSDLAGIYTLGYQEGSVITGNLVHDVSRNAYGGWGIYPDEGSSNMTFTKNIVYNTQDEAFRIHYGQNLDVNNNIFRWGVMGTVDVQKIGESQSYPSMHLANNILLANGRGIYTQAPSNYYFTDDGNLYWNYNTERGAFSGPNSASGRISPEKMQAAGYYQNAIIADPLFADPENGDFTLDPASPVYQMDFELIDMSDVGIRK